MATSATRNTRPEVEAYNIGPARTTPAPRSITRRAVGWASTLVVFAVVLELTCRIEDWMMYRMPIISRYTSMNDLVIRDADGVHGRPNARFQKWVMNGLGTRGPAARAVPAPGTLRVITVGASETFGLQESPGREFPRQLEDSLNARAGRGECRDGAGAPLKFEVLNAAFAGMVLPTTDQDIRNRIRQMRPDFIFAYPSPAQYLDEEIPFAAQPDSAAHLGPPTILHALRPRSGERIREQIKLLLPEWIKTAIRGFEKREIVVAHPAGWQFRDIPSDRLGRYDFDLRRLFGTIRGVGAEPIVATHANMFMGRTNPDPYALVAWEKFYPRATGSTIIGFDSAARTVTISASADSNVAVVDAAQRLASAPRSAFADFVHFTDLGSSHMALIASEGVIEAARRTGRCASAAASTTSSGVTERPSAEHR